MVHVYLTIFVMALITTFRNWMDKQDKLERKGKETGIRKFREKAKEENRNQLLVFSTCFCHDFNDMYIYRAIKRVVTGNIK